MRKTPVVLGVLNIVFGALVAAWSLFGLIGQSFASGMMEMMKGFSKSLPTRPGMPNLPDFYGQMKDLIETVKPYFTVLLLVKVLFSVALVWIGWGLYRRISSYRKLAVYWSLCAIGINIGEAIFNLAYYLPKVNAILTEFYKNMPVGMADFQRSMSSMGGEVGAIGGVIFNSAYPIVLLILMSRASAKNDLI
jgi:hypothetical protein